MFDYEIFDLGNTKARYNALLQNNIIAKGWEPIIAWSNGPTCFVMGRREAVEVPVVEEPVKAKTTKG